MKPAVRALLPKARAVAARAYAPASGFAVGAALLARDGRVFTGCNVENASYGLTLCAERNALCHAVAEGAREFEAIAVYTPLEQPATPCGACRQVLFEFAPDLDVVLVGEGDAVVETTLARLLPDAFRFDRERA
jgi:cytidine deaminase